MDDLTLVVTLVVVLGSAIAGGLIARRVGQPVLLGYILAGVLIGPNTPGLVTDRDRVELLANVGVAFLMFALGVEFSLLELLRVRRIALLGGGLQIVLTLAFGAVVGEAIGWPLPAALLLGGAFAISSSIVAIKLLVSRGATENREAKIAFGVGVVQDLSVVPMLALLPLLAGTSENLALALVRSLGIAAIALVAVIVVGTRIVPWLLYALARTGSRELFLMAVVVIALGTGLASQQAGLSFALGAFLAGLVVSESEFEGQVLAEIIPLRDLFATVFFVAVGMLIDPLFLRDHLGVVLLLVTMAVAGKLVITAGALVAAAVDARTAILAAAVLAQMGEFSFVLAGLGINSRIIDADQYGLILAVALGSIVLAPMLLTASPRLAGVTGHLPGLAERTPLADQSQIGPPGIPRDVVICGHGRVGAELGQVLERGGFTHSIIDRNPVVVRQLRAAGASALYGDASAEPVLVRAGIEQARVLAIAIPDLVTASAAIRLARQLNPELRVIALADTPGAVAALEATGANDVVQPEFEASMGFVRQVLRWLGATAPEARTVVSGERQAFYAADRHEATPRDGARRPRGSKRAPVTDETVIINA